MPLAVVVGLRAGDGVGESGPGSEDQGAVVLHVQVPVVVARQTSARVTETDQLASHLRRGLEPRLQGVIGRVGELPVAGDTGWLAEARGRPGSRRKRSRCALGHRAVVLAMVF